MLIYNIFEEKKNQIDNKKEGNEISSVTDQIEKQLLANTPKNSSKSIIGTFCCNFHDDSSSQNISTFIESSYFNFLKSELKKKKAGKKNEKKNEDEDEVTILPKFKENSTVFLNIPMDIETPGGRLLRPQSLSVEYLLRNFNNVFCYRMDLGKARDAKNKQQQLIEKKKFQDNLKFLKKNNNLKLLVTDSQAIDVIDKWTIDDNGEEICDITTFSIAMINFMSNGRLNVFLNGLKVLDKLKKGDKVLIAEACNHNRLCTTVCQDIGTVQLPNKIKSKFGKDIIVDNVFGREYQTKDLSKYKLLVHW